MNSGDELKYELKLFIAGMTPGSFRAIERIRNLCDNYLGDGYDLEVIDIYQQRNLVKEMNIIAIPTLIRISPGPEKRIIGDMRDIDRITSILEISTK